MNPPPLLAGTRRAAVLACLALGASAPTAQLRLSALFSDGMVLQRERSAPVWGWASPGAEVRVSASWTDSTFTTAADRQGRWQLVLSTPEAGGPYELRVTCGAEERTVSDVLVGEVWIASGQSNMELPVSACASAIPDYEAKRAAMHLPRLRRFDVKNDIEMRPAQDVEGHWAPCEPETWPDFSAVAAFFGEELLQDLDVPIGLIEADWGGTAAESWTSERALRADFPEFADDLQRLDEAVARGNDPESLLQGPREAWWKALEGADPGSAGEAWAADELDLEGWTPVSVPTGENDPVPDFDGVVWFRREVEIPAALDGQELVLELGAIDDLDTTWLGGTLVGSLDTGGRWETPRRYVIPAEAVHAGRHALVVRVVDTGGFCRFATHPEELRLAPEGGGEEIPLAGTWQMRRGVDLAALQPYPYASWFHPSYPSALFDGMIAPLVPYALRGVIWYQGEANWGRGRQYRRLFPALIRDWRERWGSEFPFLFVQIAPYGYGDDSGEAAEVREAQEQALSVPNTGMAVTMDLGNPADIHPRRKREVGHRLALLALAHAYGRRDLEVSGPIYRGLSLEDGTVRLSFEHAEGLCAQSELTGFTVAGEDRVFHPATARIEGENVLVESPEVAHPVAVRYAWGAADASHLFNAAGLPASSFRTDDWE